MDPAEQPEKQEPVVRHEPVSLLKLCIASLMKYGTDIKFGLNLELIPRDLGEQIWNEISLKHLVMIATHSDPTGWLLKNVTKRSVTIFMELEQLDTVGPDYCRAIVQFPGKLDFAWDFFQYRNSKRPHDFSETETPKIIRNHNPRPWNGDHLVSKLTKNGKSLEFVDSLCKLFGCEISYLRLRGVGIDYDSMSRWPRFMNAKSVIIKNCSTKFESSFIRVRLERAMDTTFINTPDWGKNNLISSPCIQILNMPIHPHEWSIPLPDLQSFVRFVHRAKQTSPQFIKVRIPNITRANIETLARTFSLSTNDINDRGGIDYKPIYEFQTKWQCYLSYRCINRKGTIIVFNFHECDIDIFDQMAIFICHAETRAPIDVISLD